MYETLFYANDFDVDTILSEMKRGNTIIPDIAGKMTTGLLFKGKLDNDVQSLGLQFWSEFVEQRQIEKQKPSKKEIQYIDIVHNEYYGIFPTIFSFDEGYINSTRDHEIPRNSMKLYTTKRLNEFLNVNRPGESKSR